MSRRLRCVFDTNVVVSALMLASSTPRQAWNKARAQGTVLVSTETLAELAAVLRRPKIAVYVRPPESAAFLEELARTAEIVPAVTRVAVVRDPKDDMFLSLAVSGAADYLVTGDRKHLLPLGSYGSTRIVTSREFLDLL